MEAIRYSSELSDSAVRPWRGKLWRSDRGVWYISHFNDRGEIDEDPNATAYAQPDQVFETESEALFALAKVDSDSIP